MAFYETVMVKGYETLVDPDTRVDVNTGMIAAARLQALPQHAERGDHRDDEFVAITAPEMPEGGQPDQAHHRHQHDRRQHGLGQRGEQLREEKRLFSTNLGVGRPGDTPRALK